MAKVVLASLTPGDKEGWLTKSGGSVKSWKKRWAVLKGSELYYFKAKKDTEAAKGVVELSLESFVKEDPTSAKRHCIAVGTTKRVYFMHFDSANEMRGWISAIARAIGVLTGAAYESTPIAIGAAPRGDTNYAGSPTSPNKFSGLLSGNNSGHNHGSGAAQVQQRGVQAPASQTPTHVKQEHAYEDDYDNYSQVDPHSGNLHQYGHNHAHTQSAMLQYEEVQEDGDTHGYHDDSDMQESMFDFDEATGQFFESNTSSSVHHEPPLYPDAKYAGGNNYDNYDNGEDYENEYYENDAAYEGELCRTSFYTNRSKLLNAGKICNQCAGNVPDQTRCIVCGDTTAKFQLAGMCDECVSFSGDYCMICGVEGAQNRAYLCSYCEDTNKGHCTRRKY